jgi:hypothetical protein
LQWLSIADPVNGGRVTRQFVTAFFREKQNDSVGKDRRRSAEGQISVHGFARAVFRSANFGCHDGERGFFILHTAAKLGETHSIEAIGQQQADFASGGGTVSVPGVYVGMVDKFILRLSSHTNSRSPRPQNCTRFSERRGMDVSRWC